MCVCVYYKCIISAHATMVFKYGNMFFNIIIIIRSGTFNLLNYIDELKNIFIS